MKIKIQKAIRVIIPFFACALILLCSVVPVYAYDYPVLAGKYTIVSDMAQPRFPFDVTLQFTSNNTTFDSIRFVEGTDTTLPSLRFGYTVVATWQNGVPVWVSHEYRNIVLSTDQTSTDSDFIDWFTVNSTHYSLSDNTQEQIKDGLLNGWDDIKDMYSGSLLPGSFAAFSAVLAVFWESPVLMKIVTLAVAFVLCGFIVFGESKHG